jgi:hypothetical protein
MTNNAYAKNNGDGLLCGIAFCAVTDCDREKKNRGQESEQLTQGQSGT